MTATDPAPTPQRGPSSAVVGLLLVVSLAVLALAGCSPTGSVDDTGAESPSAEDGLEQLSFFPEGLVNDLNDLQWAIDLRFDQDRIGCLRAAGWDVRPNSLESIQANATAAMDPLSQLQAILRSEAVDDIGNPTADPNSSYYGTLSEQERAELFEQNRICISRSEWNRGHPLGEQGTVYADAYAVASDRVSANTDYLVSLAAAERCFEEAGFGPRADALVLVSNEAIELLEKLATGEVDRGAASDRAAQLASLEADIERVEAQCYDEHGRLTESLFTIELSNEVARSPDLQAEILRLESFVEDYREILDDIQGDS